MVKAYLVFLPTRIVTLAVDTKYEKRNKKYEQQLHFYRPDLSDFLSVQIHEMYRISSYKPTEENEVAFVYLTS